MSSPDKTAQDDSEQPDQPDTQSKPKAVFTTGSTMRHVVVMTATGSVGLMAIFLVDIANLFYISLLGQRELAAAIGYASTIMFFSISIGIGLTIAATAIVARSIGAGESERSRKLAATSLFYVGVLTSLFAIALYPALESILYFVGARDETLRIALEFMQIVTPSIPIMGMGMCLSGILRAKGDARRAMHVTLSGGVAAAILDPILIFTFDLGLNGAAIATVLTRIVLLLVGIHGAHRVHRQIGQLDFSLVKNMAKPFATIAGPAVITQIATPVGNAYVTASIASFGDDAVAGWAIVGRLIPLTFGAIFALSGSVGPILSQNYGARLFPRVQATMRDALLFSLAYSILTWVLLALCADLIVQLFNAQDDAASFVRFFCYAVAGSFIFNGFLFVANAAFNNLGHPFYATIFNWGRATLGVIPFVYVGKSYGAEGVLAGWGLGAIVFGIGAVIVAFRTISKLPDEQREKDDLPPPATPPAAHSPFSSGKASAA
ncbi:MAG: MATE family efflux transporter [Pseudomonadota bacterium]